MKWGTKKKDESKELRREKLKNDPWDWDKGTFEKCWKDFVLNTKKNQDGKWAPTMSIDDFLNKYQSACQRLESNKGVMATYRTEDELKALIRSRKTYLEASINKRAVGKKKDKLDFPKFKSTSGNVVSDKRLGELDALYESVKKARGKK